MTRNADGAVGGTAIARRLVAEAVGTALLLTAIVGSGIMAERLADGQVALALLANALATSATLVTLILIFGPISGGHLNPAVTIADATQGGLSWGLAAGYVVAQGLGAIAGVWLAHAMFELPVAQVGQQARSGWAMVLAEFVATFGLLAVIWGCVRQRAEAVPFAVGLYILGAFWFTSSTSFANPAVSISRALTDTFTGIRPVDVPAFVAAELAGGLAATLLFRWLVPSLPSAAPDVVIPHGERER